MASSGWCVVGREGQRGEQASDRLTYLLTHLLTYILTYLLTGYSYSYDWLLLLLLRLASYGEGQVEDGREPQSVAGSEARLEPSR